MPNTVSAVYSSFYHREILQNNCENPIISPMPNRGPELNRIGLNPLNHTRRMRSEPAPCFHLHLHLTLFFPTLSVTHNHYHQSLCHSSVKIKNKKSSIPQTIPSPHTAYLPSITRPSPEPYKYSTHPFQRATYRTNIKRKKKKKNGEERKKN